ncbi:MAG TPA: hypothetical protein VIU15_27830 [Streptomyces sp.]
MAQRRMRKSAREAEARERVRARRVRQMERERRLEDLATGYELAALEIRDVTEAAEARIAAYAARQRRDAETGIRVLRDRQSGYVREMLTLDGTRSVADRLGEIVETVRRAASAEPAGKTGEPAPEIRGATATGPQTPKGQSDIDAAYSVPAPTGTAETTTASA